MRGAGAVFSYHVSRLDLHDKPKRMFENKSGRQRKNEEKLHEILFETNDIFSEN